MNRKALLAAIVGILSVLGSCVPLGNAVWQTWGGHPTRVLLLSAQAPISAAAIQIAPGVPARVALLVSLKAREQAGSGQTLAVPATLRVRDSAGQVLLEETRDTRAGGAGRGDGRIAKSGDGQLEVHYDFAAFMAPADGRILLDASIAAQRDDGATLEKAEITINDGLGDHAVGVTFGVFMLLAGWIAAVVGVLTLLGNPSPPGVQTEVDAGERRLALRTHLFGLLVYPLPFLHLLVMSAAWLRGRQTSAFVEEHGREALNFQLSILVYLLIAFTLSLALIGLLMLPLVLLFQVVMTIEAAVQARAGHRFRYPLTFRFLRAPV